MAQKDGAKPAASIINTKTVGHSIEVSVSPSQENNNFEVSSRKYNI